jgi:hypothetical protein
MEVELTGNPQLSADPGNAPFATLKDVVRLIPFPERGADKAFVVRGSLTPAA